MTPAAASATPGTPKAAGGKPPRGPARWNPAVHESPDQVLPAITEADMTQRINSKLLREYVRSYLVMPVLERMVNTALGRTRFPTPVGAFGTVLALPAPASVQISAAKEIVRLGLPGQLGLVDDDGNAVVGVIALPVLDANPLQQVAVLEPGERPLADALPGATGYVVPAGLEAVEVEEGAPDATPPPDAAPPPPRDGDAAALAILARRKRRRHDRAAGRID